MDANFTFSCHSELDCFNGCCRGADIFLTPYDVLRMKNGLGIGSEEFLKTYTGVLLNETGPPVIFLGMKSDKEKSCHFSGEKGCEIYEYRPGQCRAFPLKAVGMGNYTIIEDAKCLGLKNGREWKLDEWKKDQGIDTCNEIDDLFRDVTLDEKLLKKNMQDLNILQMFLMVFDTDKFKRFVFESKFLDVFDIGDEEIKKMEGDEAELLKFAIKWLKFGLVDKEALKMKEPAPQSRKE